MSQPDLKPCESAHYVHCCIGGAQDGCVIPSSHCYETLRVGEAHYVRRGSPVQYEGPETLHVLNCEEDYMEPVGRGTAGRSGAAMDSGWGWSGHAAVGVQIRNSQ